MYSLHLALRRARAYLALLAAVVLLASLLFHLAEGVPLGEARELVATFSDDAANVYLTLEALGGRPDLRVIAAASTREAERALYRAGAASVISPTLVAGGMLVRHALDGEGGQPR